MVRLIKMDLKEVEHKCVLQDRDQCLALANAVMNLWVP
jgi:hypothetical protein